MANERVLRIAETGQIPANDPVSNIMSQVNFNNEEPGLWDSFKNWAGSKGGRMTLGGLGSALGVGLAGGDFKDALGYGIIGAGNTAKTMYRNGQDAKRWADREAQRNLYWQNYEANRQQQKELQDARIAAQEDLADRRYQNALNELAMRYQYETALADSKDARERAREDELLSRLPENQRNLARLQMKGVDLGDLGNAYYRNLYTNPNATPEDRALAEQFYENRRKLLALEQPPLTFKDLPQEAQSFAYWTSQGYAPDMARQMAGITLPSEETVEALRLEQGKSDIADNSYYNRGRFDFNNEQQAKEVEFNRNLGMEAYKAGIAEAQAAAEFNRNKELEAYKNSLPTASQREIAAQAQAMGIPESEIYQQMYVINQAKRLKAERSAAVAGLTPQIQNAEYLNAHPDLSEAARGVFKTQGTTINLNTKAEEEYRKAMAKNRAEREKGEQGVAMMRPAVEAAINRAELAARNGAGIGVVGGFLAGLGLNPTSGAGSNYADIKSANAQMNALLRQKLQATGLTGSELNSALEADAYRYTINPTDPEEVILRKLQNFRDDYLSDTPSLSNNDPLGIL